VGSQIREDPQRRPRLGSGQLTVIPPELFFHLP
jgi:hypothetical protein